MVTIWSQLKPPRHNILEKELKISSATVVDWIIYHRKVCVHCIVKNSEPIGGKGKTVEIDEAKVGRGKYYNGRIIEGNWVFGGFEREGKKIFIETVPTRGHDTLLPIIKKHILPGTTIISDCWKT